MVMRYSPRRLYWNRHFCKRQIEVICWKLFLVFFSCHSDTVRVRLILRKIVIHIKYIFIKSFSWREIASMKNIGTYENFWRGHVCSTISQPMHVEKSTQNSHRSFHSLHPILYIFTMAINYIHIFTASAAIHSENVPFSWRFTHLNGY